MNQKKNSFFCTWFRHDGRPGPATPLIYAATHDLCLVVGATGTSGSQIVTDKWRTVWIEILAKGA